MSNEEGGGYFRQPLTRDALRADLAEMELRLRIFIEAEMFKKANHSDVLDIAARVRELENLRRARDRGELTPALSREVRALARAEADSEKDREWTGRDRVLAVVSVLTAAAMLLLSILLAIHGGGF